MTNMPDSQPRKKHYHDIMLFMLTRTIAKDTSVVFIDMEGNTLG